MPQDATSELAGPDPAPHPGPGPLPPPRTAEEAARLSAIREHPGFRAASLAMARNGVELYQGNRFLNVVANDRGRFIVALLSMAMHHGLAGPGGLTSARLRAACAGTGLCSPGRARALLALMGWAGYLAAEDGRLRPTPRLVAMHRERIGPQLLAIARVLPEARPAAERIAEEAVLAGFCIAQAGSFLAGTRFVDHAPEIAVFVERNAGLLVLFSLHLAEAGELPAASATVAALSRRFQVSRRHVTLMLQAAEREGLIARDAAERVVLSPALRAGLDRFFGAAFRLNADCAVAAIRWAEGRA